MPLPVFVLLLSYILLWHAINPLSQRNFYIYFYHFYILLCRCMFCLVWDPFWLKSFMNNFFSLGLLAVNSLSFFSSVKSLFYLHFQRIFFSLYRILGWQDMGFFPFHHFSYITPLSCGLHCLWWEVSFNCYVPSSLYNLSFISGCLQGGFFILGLSSLTKMCPSLYRV